MLSCGWIVGELKALDGWDDIRAYRAVFFAYAVVGLIKLVLALALSKKCEADPEPPRESPSQNNEEAPLLGGQVPNKKKPGLFSRLFPHISPESTVILTQLSLLFALDAFASGLASLYVLQLQWQLQGDMETLLTS